jgi:hypothetical protein
MEDKKVICIADIEHLYITKGKIYDVYSEVDNEYNSWYKLKNDKTYVGLFEKEFFKDIREIRDRKLKELGI